jgi:hypothetical protein
MGGSALQQNTERADPQHYLNVYVQVQRRLQSEWPEAVTYLPRKHRYKQDHGDLDLLVRRDTVDLTRDWVKSAFGVNEVVVNDGVWTFGVGLPAPVSEMPESTLQVDLVTKRREHWEMSKTFFDQSGLGNLMGKLARWLRYKWGFQGLRMPVYRDPQGERSVKYGEYVLTRDPQEAFEFLGFDYERFQEGFQDMTEIFEYVRSSEHFCKEPFMPENMTADQKQRDRKRPVWDQFKNYLRDLEQLGELPSKPETRPTQEEAVKRAKEAFPQSELHTRLEEDKTHLELREKAKETWTGRVPMKEFGVKGRELGQMLENFYGTFTNERRHYEWLVQNSREEALERFKWANSDHFDQVDEKKARGSSNPKQSLHQDAFYL